MKEYSVSMEDEKIEILPVELLDQNRSILEELKRVAGGLRLEFGWHYLLDLTWIIQQLGEVPGKRIMDAGAGTGVMQWYLAEHGAEVTSVDRASRAALPLIFRSQVQVEGLRKDDLHPAGKTILENFESASKRNLKAGIKAIWRDIACLALRPNSPGRVLIYNQNLANLVDIPDNSLDAVVAVSALEHNTPEWLEKVLKELMRVIKPGGVLLATVNAARDQDWWHEPSSGWCFTDGSLKKLFELPQDVPSNYQRYDELFAALSNCSELRDNLAGFYFRSGNNGMPWGKWEPKYQPVGIRKIKRQLNVQQY